MHSYFFFNDTATTEIYTLSLHDALPIFPSSANTLTTPKKNMTNVNNRFFMTKNICVMRLGNKDNEKKQMHKKTARSEEHTSELQSRQYLVCRLLLEKKKNTTIV